MSKKIIFIDVDGTLVNYDNYLPESAVQAIKAAQANGHLVVPVTGRSKAEMYDEILGIGFDGYIGGNGNYVEWQEAPIFHKHLTLDDTTVILDWLHARGLEYYVEANSGLYASENFETRGKQTMIDYTAFKGRDNAEAMTVRKAFPEMIFGADTYRDDTNKISFILDSFEDVEAARERFSEYQVGTWGGVGEKALFGDVALPGIDKSVGIDFLLQYLGLDKADAFAFGDAKVDIPMMEHSGVAVAMGNAGSETKAIADYITDAVEDDGMANAFKHYGLID